MDIKTATINDSSYPKQLKQITDAPKTLYYKGELRSDEPCFAVVGTRRNSAYGKQLALEIAGDLAQAGLTIVSGLAPGIDTFAHQAALERGKRTIAVLGTGIDEESIYPRENLKLAQNIVAAGGCLLSEYPAGTRGNRFTFPQRNRIIAGLSLGVLVVEAKQKSGALITANWAKSQARDVFAVPGPVYSANSKGCHYVIKQGARLVESASDILKDLDLACSIPGIEQVEEVAGESKEEDLILQCLKQGPLDIDKIIEKAGLTASVVAASLTNLEINDMVRNLGGNIFALKR